MDTYLAEPAPSASLGEEARDYLKILHALVTGEWAAETTPEDEQVHGVCVSICEC